MKKIISKYNDKIVTIYINDKVYKKVFSKKDEYVIFEVNNTIKDNYKKINFTDYYNIYVDILENKNDIYDFIVYINNDKIEFDY